MFYGSTAAVMSASKRDVHMGSKLLKAPFFTIHLPL